jgi:hypothetical protein
MCTFRWNPFDIGKVVYSRATRSSEVSQPPHNDCAAFGSGGFQFTNTTKELPHGSRFTSVAARHSNSNHSFDLAIRRFARLSAATHVQQPHHGKIDQPKHRASLWIALSAEYGYLPQKLD